MITATWVIPLGIGALALISFILPRARIAWTGSLALFYLIAALIAQAAHLLTTSGPLSGWLFLTMAVFSIFGLWYSVPYIEREAREHGWSLAQVRIYYGFFLIFVASLIALGIWTNFLYLWIAMEVATLSSVVLVAVPKQSRSLEAAWKYVMVTEVGGLIALLGTVLALAAAHIPLWSWHPSAATASLNVVHQRWALIGALLALIGYATKAGLAPFHTWLPDAHSEAPSPVSALLSGLKLAGGVVIIYRLDLVLSHIVPVDVLKDSLILLGLFSLVVAAAFVGFQRDLKRLWAYSSIEHIGLIALGVGFGGIALIGAALHIWTHAATKTLLFHNAGTVRLLYHTSTTHEGARAVLTRTPWSGGLLALGAAAVVGLPPFAPFWSEWLILAGGFHVASDRPFAFIAAGLLIVIFIALAKRIPEWLFTPGPADAPPRHPIREPAVLIAPSALLAVLVLVGGVGLPLLVHPLWTQLTAHLGQVNL